MILLAMDRASVRMRDANGYLHVESSHISKANVCSYYGAEIPGGEALGLQPDKLYDLYRDPDELARAAETFNNVPVLSGHVPVIPEDGLPEDMIIGSTGTDATFSDPFLDNSLVIWSIEAQDGIESERKRELSCGYRYRADMTAGRTPDGLPYDGVMRDIMGNHVALVIEGRAGPDVVVGDDLMKLKSRTALMISGAIAASVRPRLAADAKVDITAALAGVDAKTFALDGAPKKLADKVLKLVKPHLATDASLTAADLTAAISTIVPLALDEDKIDEKEKQGEDEDDEDEKDEKQAQDKSGCDEDPDAKEKGDGADDDEDDDEDDDKKQGMDGAAVRRMIANATAKAEKRGRQAAAALEIAKKDVFPLVGELIGLDSAEAVYKFALDAKDVDTKGVDPSAFKAMVAMLPKAGVMAQDSRRAAPAGKLAKIVPNLPPVVRA